MQIEIQKEGHTECLVKDRTVLEHYIETYKGLQQLEAALNKAVIEEKVVATVRKTEILFCFESVRHNKLQLKVAFQNTNLRLKNIISANMRIADTSSVDSGERPDHSLSELPVFRSQMMNQTSEEPNSKGNIEAEFNLGDFQIAEGNNSFAESIIPGETAEALVNSNIGQKDTTPGRIKILAIISILVVLVSFLCCIDFVYLFSKDELIVLGSFFEFSVRRYDTINTVLKDTNGNVYGINKAVHKFSLFSGMKPSFIHSEPKFIFNDEENLIFITETGEIYKINSDLTETKDKFTFNTLKKPISAVKHDSGYILVSDADLNIYRIPLKKEQRLSKLSGIHSPAKEMIILPGNILVTFSEDGERAVFNLDSNQIIKRSRNYSYLRCLCRIDDYSVFMITANKAFIWDLKQDSRENLGTEVKHTAHLCAVKGRNVYIYDENNGLAVVNLDTGENRTYPWYRNMLLSIQ